MQCEKFDQRIHRLLDERRPIGPDAQLVAHAHQCPECREHLEAYGRMLEGIATQSPLEPDHEPASRIVEVAARAVRRRNLLRRGAIFCLAIAPVLFLAILPMLNLDSPEIAQVDPAIVAPVDPAVTLDGVNLDGVNSDGADDPRHPNRVHSNGVQTPAISQRLSVTLEGLAEYWPSEEIVAENPPALQFDRHQWMVEEVKPFADTMVSALHALRRTMPRALVESPSS